MSGGKRLGENEKKVSIASLFLHLRPKNFHIRKMYEFFSLDIIAQRDFCLEKALSAKKRG